jgi:hypothetical protein
LNVLAICRHISFHTELTNAKASNRAARKRSRLSRSISADRHILPATSAQNEAFGFAGDSSKGSPVRTISLITKYLIPTCNLLTTVGKRGDAGNNGVACRSGQAEAMIQRRRTLRVHTLAHTKAYRSLKANKKGIYINVNRSQFSRCLQSFRDGTERSFENSAVLGLGT